MAGSKGEIFFLGNNFSFSDTYSPVLHTSNVLIHPPSCQFGLEVTVLFSVIGYTGMGFLQLNFGLESNSS